MIWNLDSRVGTKRSAADTIRIRYDTDLSDTIRILYDKNVHDLRFQNQELLISTTKSECFCWSLQWIQQILMLKRIDHLCSVYHSFIYKVFVHSTQLRSNLICLSLLLNCIKVKCETNRFRFGTIRDHHMYWYNMMIVSIRIGWCLYRHESNEMTQ